MHVGSKVMALCLPGSRPAGSRSTQTLQDPQGWGQAPQSKGSTAHNRDMAVPQVGPPQVRPLRRCLPLRAVEPPVCAPVGGQAAPQPVFVSLSLVAVPSCALASGLRSYAGFVWQFWVPRAVALTMRAWGDLRSFLCLACPQLVFPIPAGAAACWCGQIANLQILLLKVCRCLSCPLHVVRRGK